MHSAIPRIIPAPRQTTRLAGGHWSRAVQHRWRIAVEGPAPMLPQIRYAISLVARRLMEAGLPRPKVVAGSRLKSDLVLVVQKDAIENEQGYLLRAQKDGPVVLTASSSAGLIHAAATLVQIMEVRSGEVVMPAVEIVDWPAFRLRGNNWLMKCEIAGWSYDRGDGLRAYEKRILRKLDLCAMHKVNFVVFDGFTWNVERFPGHSAFMRRMNRAASERGIRLCFGGYGAYVDGQHFLNRKSYPDGPEYPCMGFPPGHAQQEKSRLAGTCLSNRTLLKLRQDRLSRFVEAIEPGALYLHNLDTGLISESGPVWNQRCPACRKRWPNDDVTAADGMAGAFGWFYKQMANAILRVKPDCELMVVSPGYTAWNESDADWESDCRYFVTVSKTMGHSPVMFGLREQFVSQAKPRLRYAELRRRLEDEGNGHRIANIYFYGGDYFYNNHPFLAGPALNHYFVGADTVMNGNGSGFQEPQQLLNAQCMWNPAPGPILTFDKFLPHYKRVCRGEERPAWIFRKGGFLDAACSRLYGEKAGPLVARMYRLQGRAKLGSPGFARYERTPVWLPVFNYLSPDGRSFRHCGVTWRKELSATDRRKIARLAVVYDDVVRLNREGGQLVRRAVRRCPDADAAGDLRWMGVTLDAAREFAQVLGPFLRTFLAAHAAMRTGRKRAATARTLAGVNRRIARLQQRINAGKFGPATDIDRGELWARTRAIEVLRKLSASIQQSLRTGQWPL